ncbi:type VII secretion target [Nocardia huaxiensis]|uniref:type VII secretion target n=1 Tax=Nocardia huaxiensis TaxID=2755382 RepID=UPI0023EA9BBB|nr:type VII secretion target [Nocardia huaxiensis]
MFSVTPENLKTTANRLRTMSDEVADTGKVPHLGASRGVTGMAGSAIAAALGDADPASAQAKTVLQSRLDAFGQLLDTGAALYSGQDTDVAARFSALPDLNQAR